MIVFLLLIANRLVSRKRILADTHSPVLLLLFIPLAIFSTVGKDNVFFLDSLQIARNICMIHAFVPTLL